MVKMKRNRMIPVRRQTGFDVTRGLLVAALLALPAALAAQVVQVTASLDHGVISAGQTTTLRVFAQIVPAQQAGTDRIFSWYIDLWNTNGITAQGVYTNLVKTASDNDASTSSTGTTIGSDRKGIHDTFINLPNAGRLARVELLSVPVTALAAGQTQFRVQAGTTVSGLSADFLVAPAGGGDPLTGADYSAAFATLTVAEPTVTATISKQAGNLLQINFNVLAGKNHTVEYRDTLEAGAWQPLPGGPHNSGSVTVTNETPRRFFRVRIDTAPN